MRKLRKLEIFQKIIPVFFLLVFVEVVALKIRKEISFPALLEIISGLLLIIIYYFMIRLEFKIASEEVENRLKVLLDRFDKIEDNLKHELKMMSEEISDLKSTLKKIRKRKR